MCEELPYSGMVWYIYNDSPNTQPQLIEVEHEPQPLLYNHKGDPLYKQKEPMGFRLSNN